MQTVTPEVMHLAGNTFSHPNGTLEPSAGDVFVFPTTIAQQAFWYLDQLEAGNPAYNIAVWFRLQGPLRVLALEQALNDIIERHETLRTVFATVDGEAVQVIVPELSIRLSVLDLRDLPPTVRPARVDALAIEEAGRRFDLSSGPLIRAGLLRLEDEDHVLLVTVHHIVSDGWSIGILSDELVTLYDSHFRGLPSPLADLPVQYADFAVWQNEWLKTRDLSDQLSYWVQQLANLPVVEIPTDRPRPAVPTFSGRIESVLLPRRLTDRLQVLSIQQGCTLFMLSLAALEAFLERRTGQEDIVVGTLVAGRSRVELEPLIGLFRKTVALRTNLSGDPTFSQLLARIRDTVLQAFAHEDVPFERVIEAMSGRDHGRRPVFQINFIFQRDFVRPREVSGLTLTAIPSKSPGATYDLNFFMVERADGWRASCEYNTDLYDATTVTDMLEQFQSLLEEIAANHQRRISEIPMLTVAEREQLSITANGQPVRGALRPQQSVSEHTYVAPRNDIEVRLCKLWEQVLGVERISAVTDFFDAGGHSLLAVKLLSQIERAFNRKLPLAALLQAPTVQAFAGRLLQESALSRRDQVFAIQPKGSRPPLFVLTSQPVFFYRRLSRRLDVDQPMYGLAWPELATLPANFSAGDIATNVIESLCEIQPHGPYYLGGWCMSGLVVYEMAQQLRARGEQVALVILFDANNPDYIRQFNGVKALPVRVYFMGQRLAYKLGKLRRMGLVGAQSYVLRRVQTILENVRRLWGKDNDQSAPRHSIELQSRVAAGYEPKPYPGPVVLFRSAAYQTGRFRDPTLGWRKVTQGKFDVHEIPGEHHDMFLEPHVDLLAEKLKSYLPRNHNLVSVSAESSFRSRSVEQQISKSDAGIV
jgi:thioesterase domain-containing protein